MIEHVSLEHEFSLYNVHKIELCKTTMILSRTSVIQFDLVFEVCK